MARLNVNIDHVATIRQARGGNDPDPVAAALICELAGARGIVMHLREDRRHAQEKDLEVLKKTIKSKLNMEMAATDEMIIIAEKIKPHMVTLVPEKREELTTEGGLNVYGNLELIKNTVSKLKQSDIFVSLFIDPEDDQIHSAKDSGAGMVELHTGSYAEAKNEIVKMKELKIIKDAVETALSIGLRVSAGHGLNYYNVREVAIIDGIEELNIGHSIVSRAVLVGMDEAVRDMVYLCGG
ncbi:MAG: pyridoxine 5'-phosphate synthase [Thermodesulfobacteriota bacterium]